MTASAHADLAVPFPVNVLVVDDERDHADAVAEGLERIGCQCEKVYSGEDALARLSRGGVDIVVTDMRMGEVDGMAVVEAAMSGEPGRHAIVLTAYPTFEVAVGSMTRGALTCLRKPINIGELRAEVERVARTLALKRENEELRRQLDRKFGFEGIIGESEPMARVFEALRQISPTDATVLIQGESGSGKEMVARAIHHNSPRRGRNLVAFNCAALSESILESELFGHEKGAFTGADVRRVGRIEYAQGGTLFLDEVADMPAGTQIKLLRVLEEREITRVGSNESVPVDIRLVTATNQDLEQCVREGRFRQDLFFRLNVVRIYMPPLRERTGDIPILIEAFLREFSERYDRRVEGVTPEARRLLNCYHWPGNVRELKNAIESMVVVARGTTLDAEDIPVHIHKAPPAPAGDLGALVGRPLDEVERELIERTLEACSGNREQTARLLGIGERTLYRKLARYGLK